MIPFHILSAFILLTLLNSGIGQGGLKFLFYSRVYLGENFVKLYVGLISGNSYISHYVANWTTMILWQMGVQRNHLNRVRPTSVKPDPRILSDVNRNNWLRFTYTFSVANYSVHSHIAIKIHFTRNRASRCLCGRVLLREVPFIPGQS